MEGRKLLSIIRYLAIMFLVFGLAAFKEDNVDIYTVIFVLLFIINNQIRFYILFDKRLFVVISLAVECILSSSCYLLYGGIQFFYYFTVVLDCAFLLSGKKIYIINGLIIMTMVSISRNLSIIQGKI